MHYKMQQMMKHGRAAFYRHMGHAEDVSESVCQCPAAVQEVCKIGKYFDKLDNQTADWLPQTSQQANIPSQSTNRSINSDSDFS